LEKPVTQPWLLMASPRLTVPPSDDESLTTSYCGVGFSWASAPIGSVIGASVPQPHMAAIRMAREVCGIEVLR
jgi:hypothetical protein